MNTKPRISQTNEFTDGVDLISAKEARLIPNSFISPLFIMWDVTYNCPFKCIFCYNNSGGHGIRNELKKVDLLRIADEISQASVITVCLCGGEPFVRLKEFVAVAERLSDSGVNVNCVSNGWCISPGILEQLKGSIKTIQLSLDGPNPQTHDFIRGKKGAFEQVMKAIECIRESSLGTCDLTFIPTRINYRLFPDVVELAIHLGCVSSLRTQHLIQTGRGYQLDLHLNKKEEEEFQALFMETYALHHHEIDLVFGDPWAHINDFCGGLVPPLFLQITAQGLAKISPYIPLTVGDLKKESLPQIWKRINDHRDRLIEFLSKYKKMNTFPDDRIPWIHRDIDLEMELL